VGITRISGKRERRRRGMGLDDPAPFVVEPYNYDLRDLVPLSAFTS
jgi:hypothetical protein